MSFTKLLFDWDTRRVRWRRNRNTHVPTQTPWEKPTQASANTTWVGL